MAKLGCASMMLGIVSMLLAVVCKLGNCMPMHLGPRNFASGAALMLLLSIAAHSCAMTCFGACGDKSAQK